MKVKEIGRRQWKQAPGYHHQTRMENTYFRYKTIIGPGLRSRYPEAQEAEAVISCNMLNRMTHVGMPEFLAIGT
jgi:hypothetical protein